jgi:hypothetical protein
MRELGEPARDEMTRREPSGGWQWSSRRAAVLIMLTTLVLIGAGQHTRPDLEALRTRWDELMLLGQGANIWFDAASGAFREVLESEKREQLPAGAAGDLADAFARRTGIVIGLPPRQSLLLWRRDGWILSGGLLRQIRLADGDTVELYGRSVKKEDGFYPPTRLHNEPPREMVGIDFFLLRRPRTAGRARVLRTWRFRSFSDPIATEYKVKGDLALDEAGRTVSVTLSGLGAPVIESVPIATE